MKGYFSIRDERFREDTPIMENVIITGGTGLLGTELSRQLLESGYRVTILTRGNTDQGTEGVSRAHWDPLRGEMDEKAIAEADYLIHLAGTNIGAGRWTAARRKQIRDSRVEGGKLICKSLQRIPNQVKMVLGASALGYYGSDREKIFREKDGPADDFLGRTCVDWENSMTGAAELGKRLVIFRLGILFSLRGGALQALTRAARAGLMPIPGQGDQWMSWLHIRDAARIFVHGLSHSDMEGVYNAAAPRPVTYLELSSALAGYLKFPFFIRMKLAPFVLRILLGDMSLELLKSCRVSVERLEATGFRFGFTDCESALKQLMTTPDT